jgi:hypothetical protein
MKFKSSPIPQTNTYYLCEMHPNAIIVGKILYLQMVGVINLPPSKKSLLRDSEVHGTQF